MNRTSRLLLPAVLAATLLLAACGDDDTGNDGSADTTATLDTSSGTATTAPEPSRPDPGGGSFGTAPTPTYANLAYASTSASQVLDLWLPTDATAATPLVIYIHGGAFKGGDKAMVGGKVQPLLDAGYAVASLDYRLSGEALFPAGAQDSKAAVRWLRASADAYNLDPNRFAAWGESAGGNLVALIGTSGDQTTVLDDPALGNADVSSAVQAVVDWYGPTDFLQMDAQAASGGGCTDPESHDPASSPESAWMGAAIQTVPDTVAQANPITYIATATDLPAFSIAHGDADCNVAYQQSQILADALSEAGASPQLTILPGAAHADAQFDGTLLTPTIAWLGTVLDG
ncbi:MAG: alpha/beta hydrolase [Acidimicrobiales bacterium]|nr:alpha/beta hydrolase [Acidimicrobiales bacterium]